MSDITEQTSKLSCPCGGWKWGIVFLEENNTELFAVCLNCHRSFPLQVRETGVLELDIIHENWADK